MKKILKYSSLLLIALTVFIACDTDGDDPLATDLTAGGTVAHMSGSGKILGTPANSADLENSVVALDDAQAELSLHLYEEMGYVAQGVEKFQLTKSFNNGSEQVVAESITLPFDFSYSTVAEFIDGMGVASINDLRIGDTFTFRLRNLMTDGNIYYQADTYDVVVNCLSDLAGMYSLRMVSDNGYDIVFPNEMISELSPGVYATTTTYRWAPGNFAWTPTQGFEFNDQCGILAVPFQGLFQNNYPPIPVEGTSSGSVDPNTGDLVINYKLTFSNGDVNCIGYYTKL